MITSHRDRRAFQNYDYNSRSAPIFYLKSQILSPALRASWLNASESIRRPRPGVTAFLRAGRKAPNLSAGALRALVAVAAVRAGPDEGVTLAILVIEEVGVDRSGEARIVQLEAQIVAALIGALGPGGADLGAAD